MNNLNSVPDFSTLTPRGFADLATQRPVRLKLGQSSFLWFFHLYFGHYVTYPTADFQKQIIAAAGDPTIEHLVVMAFRESGKSTLITTAFPLWAITGELQKKYVVIVSQTQSQAQQHLKNIAAELDDNELMHKDFWPYDAEENELGISAITLPKFKAKIIALSREQGMRGLRHGPYRPDLIIADDVEDSASVKTAEGRRKTYEWFTGELLPLGSDNTKFVTVGNLLHEDSLLMRLKAGFVSGTRNGQFLEFPIVVKDVPLWPGRFKSMADVQQLKRRIDSPIMWEREYMLHLVSDDDQIIRRHMIHTYPELPTLLSGQYRRIVIGVDLAVSESDKADYTAIVTLDVRGLGESARLYILPRPFNKRVSFPTTMNVLRELDAVHHGPKFYVEQTAYQAAVPQQLEADGYDVTGVTPKADKRTRLNMIADKIQRGVILFPEHGCEELITQLTGFGIEKHDDLVDALTTAVIEYFRDDRKVGTVSFGQMDIRTFGRRPALRGYGNPSRITASMEQMPDGSWRHLA